MKKIIPILIAAALIAAAVWHFSVMPNFPQSSGSASGTATSTYSADFSVATTTIKIAHDDASATVNIEYPELSLKGIPDAVVRKINADIASGTIAFEKDFFDQVSSAQADIASLPKEAPRDSELYRRYQVFSSRKFGTVSILYSDERGFPGDAHPANVFASATYDIQTGNQLSLSDIVPAANQPELYVRAATSFGTKYGLTDDNYALAPSRLPQFAHFIIEDAGLHAYADQDSILAHVDGPADVLIPWAQLQDLNILSERFRK